MFLVCYKDHFLCRNIKRIVFYSIVKPTVNEKGEKEIDIIPPSTALQIAGRAGRYGTTWEEGQVTTFKGTDLSQLKKLLATKVDPVEVTDKPKFHSVCIGYFWFIFYKRIKCEFMCIYFILQLHFYS